MPNHPVQCPLCADVELVHHPHERFECVNRHGFFALLLKGGGAGGLMEAALRHESSGLEFGIGSFTPEGWRSFLREAGIREA